MNEELTTFLSKCNTPKENEDLFQKDTLVFNNPNAFQLLSPEAIKFWESKDRHKQFFAFMVGCKHELGIGGNKWNCGTETGSRYCDTNCYGEWARLWFYSLEHDPKFFGAIELANDSDLLTNRKFLIMIDPLNSTLGWERTKQGKAHLAAQDEKDIPTEIKCSN
jgi:hypothetical protein|tara:strand:+ start:1607 stop:2098 length:492 start_codon:yes stop_codon:yes gene_type:complete